MMKDLMYNARVGDAPEYELYDLRSVPKSYYRPMRFEDLPFHLSQSYPPREIDIMRAVTADETLPEH
jgi:hypothetical protein